MSVEDPGWPRASGLLRPEPEPGRDAVLAVVGVPLSQASISQSGAHETPAAVRRALSRFSTWSADAGVALEQVAVVDLGDLDVAGLGNEEAQAAIDRSLRQLRGFDRLPGEPDVWLVLGGDNAVTRPALRAVSEDALERTGLLTLDAHHDVRGFHAGPTNGTPVRGLISDGLPGGHVVQIGIGDFTNSAVYRRYCDDQGITVVTAAEARREGVGACVGRHLSDLARRCDRIYVDLDVDVLDVSFAPGCPGARPGGLAPWELHDAARAAGAHPAVVAVDVVEVDATADPTGVTVDNAALCLLNVAAGLATRRGGRRP